MCSIKFRREAERSMTSDRFLTTAAHTASLPEKVPAGQRILAGPPDALHLLLTEFGGAAVGLWEMREGIAEDVERDEVFLVISGSGAVTFADGERIELRPGVGVRLRS